jgi:hypothetical protein
MPLGSSGVRHAAIDEPMNGFTLNLGELDDAIARVAGVLRLTPETAFHTLLDEIYTEITNVALPLLDELSEAAAKAEDRAALRDRATVLRRLVRLHALATHSARSAANSSETAYNSLRRFQASGWSCVPRNKNRDAGDSYD